MGVRLTFIIIISLLLMFLDHRQEHMRAVRGVLASVVAPLQHLVSFPFNMIDTLRTDFASHRALLRDNTKLHAEELLLKAQVQRLLAIEEENSELKSLLHAAPKAGGKILVAQLMAVDSNPFAHEAVIDKGGRQGLYIGQPVLDANGIMGQVIEVNPFTSRIRLISDQNCAVPVQDTRNGVRAIAVGMGEGNLLSLINVQETSGVKVGDILISSGMGEGFPPGYPVGVISRINPNKGDIFLNIEVEPYAELNRSREIMVVWPNFDTVPKDILEKQIKDITSKPAAAVKPTAKL